MGSEMCIRDRAVIMKEELSWVFYSGVERMDSISLGSKNEHSLTSTKTVKNLVTMKTYLLPLPLPPKKNLVKGEFMPSINLLKRTLKLLRTVRISCSNDAC